MNNIDLIIDALEHCKGLTQIDRMHLKKALTAARELKAFREVLIRDNYILRFYPSDTGWMCGISNEMMDAIEHQARIQELESKLKEKNGAL